MIDKIHITVQGGDGGNGCESYYHRKDKKIVPNGGDGGHGARVIFRASENAQPLSNFRFQRHIVAEAGGHGGSNGKRGRNGRDLIVLIPCGTRIYDRQRGFLIRELLMPGEEVVVAEGGKGGVGNVSDKVPTVGEKGPLYEVEMTIRIAADVFLVGLPNAGRSAILNRLTRAHVKEEAYPFTTRSPELGVCPLPEERQVTLCDLPSIYSASHEGHGVGNDFLKHLEKAKFILFVLDPVSEFADSLESGLELLRQEISIYDKHFLEIPCAVIVNKMDLPEAVEKVKAAPWAPKVPCFLTSAKTGEGLDALKEFFAKIIRPESS